MDPDPNLSPAAVAHRVLTFSIGVLRLPPHISLDLADWPIGVIPDSHCPPFGIPGARLFAAQNYHHVVVLEVIRPADIAEVGKVGVPKSSTDGHPRAVLPPRQSAADALVRHYQSPIFLSPPPNERGNRREPGRG